MDKGNSCVCQLQVYIKNIISIKLGGIKYKTSSELCFLNKSVFVPGEVKPRIDFAKAGCPDKKKDGVALNNFRKILNIFGKIAISVLRF